MINERQNYLKTSNSYKREEVNYYKLNNEFISIIYIIIRIDAELMINKNDEDINSHQSLNTDERSTFDVR